MIILKELLDKIQYEYYSISSETRFIKHFSINGRHKNVPIYTDYNISMYFQLEDYNLFNNCKEWFRYISIYHSPNKNFKVDFGNFFGVFPVEIDFKNMSCVFSVDYINEKSWKDWFIINDDIKIGD